MGKSLSRVLNEAFQLFEKTSEVRKYKQYEQKPPVWFNKTIGDKAHKFDMSEACVTMLQTYYGVEKLYGSYGSKDIPYEMKKYLEKLCKSYLDEFIDENDVPITVYAGMLDDTLNNIQAWKLIKNDAVYAPYIIPVSFYNNIDVELHISKQKTYSNNIPYYYAGLSVSIQFKTLKARTSLFLPENSKPGATKKEIETILETELPKYFGKERASLILKKIDVPEPDYTN